MGFSPESFSSRVDEWYQRTKEVEFRLLNYDEAMDLSKRGDVVYCDPPYSYSQGILYGAQTFDLIHLFEMIERCKQRGVAVVLRNWESITSGILRFDGVVPLMTGSASSEIELFHFMVGNFDLLFVAALVESCRDTQAALCPGSSNKAQHGCQVSQRMSGPVAADRAEQTMIGRIPFRRAARIVTDRNRQARLIGEPLKFPLP